MTLSDRSIRHIQGVYGYSCCWTTIHMNPTDL